MTLGEIVANIERITASILNTSVDRLPIDEQLHRHFPASLLAMEATLVWFPTPRQHGNHMAAGEIRIPEVGFSYSIQQTAYTERFRAMLPTGM